MLLSVLFSAAGTEAGVQMEKFKLLKKAKYL
jgi:hypothetical protein